MDIFEVFFWFCKEQKIMDIMYKMYHEKNLGTWRYDSVYGTYFQPMSLREFLINRMSTFGFHDIFWDLQPRNRNLTENLRYKKARSKWNAFSKNNIKFSFVKSFFRLRERLLLTSLPSIQLLQDKYWYMTTLWLMVTCIRPIS